VPRATNNIEFGNYDPARHVSFVRAGAATAGAAKAFASGLFGVGDETALGTSAVLVAALQKPLRGIAGCGMI
jgi:hypothetical protein